MSGHRVGGDGEYHEIQPHELAHYDQMEAHFHALTQRILELRFHLKEAAVREDIAKVAECTQQMDALIHEEFPDPKPETINYIMYLVNVVEMARGWTDHNFDVVETVLRQLASVLRSDHEIRTLKGWDRETLDKEYEILRDTLDHLDTEDETVFTTDSGVKLENVHREQDCSGRFCVIHRPAPGPWSNWTMHWREDWRLMVRICPHDVHHIAIEEILRLPLLGMSGHEHPAGCDCPCDFTRCKTLTDKEGNIIGFEANA